jgi:AraC-like DNA-binding protein
VHALAGARQRFVGSLLLLEPGAFVSAVRRFTNDTPVAESRAEDVMARDRLTDTIARGAAVHHDLFHRFFGASACTFRSDSLPSADSFAREAVLPLLNRWAEAYAGRFDCAHAWPAAVKAAVLLQARINDAWYIDELATAVGASRATLERSFNQIYGIPAQQYHSLLKLRIAAHAMRAGTGCVDGVALDLGWRSPKDLYRALWHVTGMTLAGVQQLPDTEFLDLMHGALEVPVPGRRRERCPQRGPRTDREESVS